MISKGYLIVPLTTIYDVFSKSLSFSSLRDALLDLRYVLDIEDGVLERLSDNQIDIIVKSGIEFLNYINNSVKLISYFTKEICFCQRVIFRSLDIYINNKKLLFGFRRSMEGNTVVLNIESSMHNRISSCEILKVMKPFEGDGVSVRLRLVTLIKNYLCLVVIVDIKKSNIYGGAYLLFDNQDNLVMVVSRDNILQSLVVDDVLFNDLGTKMRFFYGL